MGKQMAETPMYGREVFHLPYTWGGLFAAIKRKKKMLILFSCTISGLLGLYLGIFGRFVNKLDLLKVIIPGFIASIGSIILVLNNIYKEGSISIELSCWLNMLSNKFILGFYIDSLSVIMSLVVSTIAFAVLIYAFEYLNNDPHLRRFLCFLLFFVFFMQILVLSTNIIMLFIGWEGVGVISYLLINFWFTRIEANKSALKAIIFNRIGDLCYLIFLVSIFNYIQTTNFSFINSLYLILDENLLNNSADFLIYLEIFFSFLFIGAMCKSAQIGLHAWLPDAMEGPTPVSALLHSATMVTAGLYVFLRLSTILLFFVELNFIIGLVGAVTALVGATIAFFNEDIKKIIAYSTCSQLGLLFSAIGLGNYNGCFFHIVTHAFFKALLFLTAGCVIHAVADEQDIRKMGGLIKYIPYTSICMLIGVLGLVGFPFLSGFYSKEFIIFFSYVQATYTSNFITVLVFFASIFTMLYGLKLYFLIFLTSYRGFISNLKAICEPSFFMSISIGFLSILTIFAGFYFYDIILYNNNFFWLNTFNGTKDVNDKFIEIELLSFFTKNSLMFFFIFFTFIFIHFSKTLIEWRLHLLSLKMQTQFIINFLNTFFFQTWFFNYIYILISYSFFKNSFNIFLFKISNFIEYFLILKTKDNLYSFSLNVRKTFSTLFFKNIKTTLILFSFLFIFIFLINISKSIVLSILLYLLHKRNTNSKKTICKKT